MMTSDNQVTDYRSWIDHKQALAEDGDPSELLRYLLHKPSPLGGLFGAELTRQEIIHNAVVDTLALFKDRAVKISATDSPQTGEPFSGSRWTWTYDGTVVGLAKLGAEGVNASDTEAVVIRTDGGLAVIRISHITHIEAV